MSVRSSRPAIGAGNGVAEVRLACDLQQAGVSDFVIDCLDLNEQSLEHTFDLKAIAELEGDRDGHWFVPAPICDPPRSGAADCCERACT